MGRALCGSRAHRGRCASGARASICDAGPRARASCSPGHRAPCAGGGCTPDCGTGASARGCAAAGVRPSLALWPPRVAAVQVTPAVARVNTCGHLRIRRGGALVDHVHIPAGRGPVVLAGRRRVGQRLAHQVQHGPCAVVWPAQARRRRALAVSRAPPGPPPRGEPCLQLRPSVRASGKRGRFLFSRILFIMTVWGLSEFQI